MVLCQVLSNIIVDKPIVAIVDNTMIVDDWEVVEGNGNLTRPELFEEKPHLNDHMP